MRNLTMTTIALATTLLLGCPTMPEICGDGLDNDGNGLADCADPTCSADPSCSGDDDDSAGDDDDDDATPGDDDDDDATPGDDDDDDDATPGDDDDDDDATPGDDDDDDATGDDDDDDSAGDDDDDDATPGDDDDDATGDDDDDDDATGDDDDDDADIPVESTYAQQLSFDVPAEPWLDCQFEWTSIASSSPAPEGCATCEFTWNIDYAISDAGCTDLLGAAAPFTTSVGLDLGTASIWLYDVDTGEWNPSTFVGALDGPSYSGSAPSGPWCLDLDEDTLCDDGSTYNFAEVLELAWTAPVDDADADGWTSDVDCDDLDNQVNPGATEIIGNDLDEDCDGLAELDEAIGGTLSFDIVFEEEGDLFVNCSRSFDLLPSGTAPPADCPSCELSWGFNAEPTEDTCSFLDPAEPYTDFYGIDLGAEALLLWLEDEEAWVTTILEGGVIGNSYSGTGTSDVRCLDLDGDFLCDDGSEYTQVFNLNIVWSPRADDVDGDGWETALDCDDEDAEVNPDATEILGNDIDEDCDGEAAPAPSMSGTLVLERDFSPSQPFDDCSTTIVLASIGSADTTGCVGCSVVWTVEWTELFNSCPAGFGAFDGTESLMGLDLEAGELKLNGGAGWTTWSGSGAIDGTTYEGSNPTTNCYELTEDGTACLEESVYDVVETILLSW